MKRLLLLVSSLLGAVLASQAATCTSGSLATYIALGSGGCTIGNNTLFNFRALTGTAGNMEIAPSAVTIGPLGGSFNPGLTISVQVTSSPPFGSKELMFNYDVKGTTYVGEAMTLSGASEPADGGVTDTINYCENGTFNSTGVLGCTGITGGTSLVNGVLNRDTFTFHQSSFLSLTDDLVITAGAGSPTSGGTITDQLTSVPEPTSYLIAVLGILVAFSAKRRSARRS
jgi:hypothetical protein